MNEHELVKGRVLFYVKLALEYQGAMDVKVPIRVDSVMRARAWHWFGIAETNGLVLQ